MTSERTEESRERNEEGGARNEEGGARKGWMRAPGVCRSACNYVDMDDVMHLSST
jgi:hypothetical protein